MATLAVVLAGSIFAFVSSGDERAATNKCEQAVRDRLRAPSTAEFGEASAEGTNDPFERVPDGQLWVVEGGVDSENGFGAMVRNYYSCRMTHDRERWQLISVNFSGEGADGLG
ncbi:hypothetical protein [Nocardioides sp. LHG3406-4]|uniref:hypothetical protein n=1 Tax=Nocardioides sp. LHG3406-4 TaxID=2804575 RepID=UPI003CEAD20A